MVALVAAACSSPVAPQSAPTTVPTTVPTAPTVPPATDAPTTVTPTTTPAVVVGVWTLSGWQPAGRTVSGSPAVATTLLHPTNATGPTVAAARLETNRLRAVLYAGTSEPAGTWAAQGAIAPAGRPTLVAAFNAGFKLSASRGGFYADGRVALALRAGAASLVIFADGSATVGEWGRDVTLTADVVAVRQNLELLVDAGQPSPNVAASAQATWGFTLNGVVANWRSAVAVDAAGRLLYVAGPGLDPSTLASALIAVGAVRAMELDINPQWVTFDTFTDGPNGVVGSKLLATMNYPAGHFLVPSKRDFVAVFAR